jgi:parallel beta-helix repeat protein
VRDIEVDTPDAGASGIVVSSDHNQLFSNTASSSRAGFEIEGDHNLLDGNRGVGQAGFFVTGHKNLLLHNIELRVSKRKTLGLVIPIY